MLTAASIVSWVIDLLCAFLLCVLWLDESSSFYFSLRWYASQGDCLGVTFGASLGGGITLGGGTTLGYIIVDDITGVTSGAGLGGFKSRWRLDTLRGTGTPTPTFSGSSTCTLWLWLGGGVGGFPVGGF